MAIPAKGNKKTIYLDVAVMKNDYKEETGREFPYSFNELMDLLIEKGATVDSNDGCKTMIIRGVYMGTVKRLAAKCGMKDIIDDYLHEEKSVDDGYMNGFRGDEMHEDDLKGEDFVADDPAAEETVEKPDFPEWDEVEVPEIEDGCNPETENGCCDICTHDDCLRLVEDVVDNEGINTMDEFEENIDIYISEMMGIPFEELDKADTETVNCVRDMLLDAWCEYTGECPVDNEGETKGEPVNEKRGKCCPGTRTVNERKLVAKEEGDQKKLKEIEKSVKGTFDEMSRMDLSAEEVRKAFEKLKKENDRLKKIEAEDGKPIKVGSVTGFKTTMDKIKEKHPEEMKNIEKFEKTLAEKVMTNLQDNKPCLHENVKVNGKCFGDMDITELKTLYERVDKSISGMMDRLTSSNSVEERAEIREACDGRQRLFDLLDEEITYRLTREKCLAKSLNEDEATISDEELANMFGPAQGGETEAPAKEETAETEENKEEVVEIKVDHIDIEMVSNEAAEELKAACVEAGIPDEVLEIKPVEEEEEATEEETTEEKPEEENTEEAPAEEEKTEDTNESLGYNIRKLLFEDENADDVEPETSSDEEEKPEENDNKEEDNNETEEVHVMLTLTDVKYVPALMDVLDDQYGITKEEFEEMVGGEVVEKEDEDEEESATEEDDKDNENEDGNKEEKEEEKIDPSELFKDL